MLEAQISLAHHALQRLGLVTHVTLNCPDETGDQIGSTPVAALDLGPGGIDGFALRHESVVEPEARAGWNDENDTQRDQGPGDAVAPRLPDRLRIDVHGSLPEIAQHSLAAAAATP